jgi:hypothetical protein
MYCAGIPLKKLFGSAGVELGASSLLGRCSTICATLPDLFFFFFGIGVRIQALLLDPLHQTFFLWWVILT